MKENHYRFLSILIIILAFSLRFYNFSSRWQIYSDQARDAMVARGALKNKTLPMIGSFSSAGPFVFGPLHYWLIMFAYLIAPKILIAPWILITLIDIFLVLIMAQIGWIIGEKKTALILAAFSSISTSQILRASNLTQHTLVSLFTALTILFFALFIKKKKLIYLFFMSLSIGTAINFHYQALNLLLYAGSIFFVGRLEIKRILLSFLLLILGLVLPNLPLLYWDYSQGWTNVKNLLDYFLIGQYRIWVSNRWLTYGLKFWPNLWTRTIGGHYLIGLIFLFLTGVFWLSRLLKKKLKKEIFCLAIIFAFQIILNRYYRGVRSEGYLLYFHPLILLFSAWLVLSLIKLNRFFGGIFFVFVFILTLNKDLKMIKRQNNNVDKVWQTISFLKEKYPRQKFSIYDFYYQEPALSQILSLFLDSKGLIDENKGIILGVSPGPIKEPMPFYQVKLDKTFYLYQLDQEIIKEKRRWINVNPDYVYQDILFWWQRKPLQSSFSLKNYLKEKLRL